VHIARINPQPAIEKNISGLRRSGEGGIIPYPALKRRATKMASLRDCGRLISFNFSVFRGLAFNFSLFTFHF
jgi:hypothetical protein